MPNNHSYTDIIFWGASAFAVPALEALLERGYHIAAVITNPDEPAGRKQIPTPPPVKIATERHGIPVMQPGSPAAAQQKLQELMPDLFIVAAYGKLLPKEILDTPKFGALNIHPSLLPRWRGAAPIQYTILSGDAETGVTIIKMDEEMDHGPIIAKRKAQSAKRKIGYKELHDELAMMGAELLIETLSKWLNGEIKPVPQDESLATYSKILTKDDGRIDWSKPAEEIERMVRAFNPWPGAWTVWLRRGKALRLRIDESDVYEVEPRKMVGSPGLVGQTGAGGIAVRTGCGDLTIKKLTLEGKKTVSAAEFLRGYPDFIGAVLS